MIKSLKIWTLENQDFGSQVVPEYWDCVIRYIKVTTPGTAKIITFLTYSFLFGQNIVAYRKSASSVPPRWVKSNACRKREQNKYVLTMASYVCEDFPPPRFSYSRNQGWKSLYKLPFSSFLWSTKRYLLGKNPFIIKFCARGESVNFIVLKVLKVAP